MWSDCCCYLPSATPHARHVHVYVHALLPRYIFGRPLQLESDQLPCSSGWLAAGAWNAPDARANWRASAYELAHCSTLAPRSAQQKMKVASPQKPSISMQQNEQLLIDGPQSALISGRVALDAHNGAVWVTEVWSILLPQRLLHRIHQ